jgi:hypothetical protein
MNDFDKLELSTETIRELSADEMSHVAHDGLPHRHVPDDQHAVPHGAGVLPGDEPLPRRVTTGVAPRSAFERAASGPLACLPG